MKSVILGIALMIAISVVAWAVMGPQKLTSESAYSSSNNSVRLD